jgi:hypothetical protein
MSRSKDPQAYSQWWLDREKAGSNLAIYAQGYYATATWPTPTKADGDGGHTMGTASATGKREDGSKVTVSLPGVVKIVSTWPTPRAVDGDKGSRTPEGCEKEIARKGRLDDLPSTIVHLSGPTTSGSPEPTANRGALNPAFPCWLMGFPIVWQMCYPSAK